MKATTRHNTIVLSVAVMTAVSIFFIYGKHHELKIDYQLFHKETGWGYNILVNDSLFIHQEYVPAKNSNKGFEDELAAKNVALYVIKKIKKKQNPTLHVSEIDSLIR